MIADKRPKKDVTRERLLAGALGLFRKRGFDRTTMRDIAGAAGMSLGAAYYHFRSKEDLVAAYYEWMQDQHGLRLAEALPAVGDLAGRVRVALRTKLDLVAENRRFLGAL